MWGAHEGGGPRKMTCCLRAFLDVWDAPCKPAKGLADLLKQLEREVEHA